MKVHIVREMEAGNGVENNKQFKDYQFLNEKEKECLALFIAKVSENDWLDGKNKPSWKNDNWDDLPNTTLYQQACCWHYHSGPSYNSKRRSQVQKRCLELNLDGDTSTEVIHYKKKSDDEIVLTCFSPNHVPFPIAKPDSPLLREVEPETEEQCIRDFLEKLDKFKK